MSPQPEPTARFTRALRRAVGAIVVTAALASMQASEPAVLQALQLTREAAAAAQAGETAAALEKLEAAASLRSDLPEVLEALARAQSAAGKHDDALATLGRLSALGIAPAGSIEAAEEFAPLRARKEFAELVKQYASLGRPSGNGETAFTLRDVTGLIEAIAWREKTGDFYFGDVHARAVWVRNKDGSLRRFTPEGDDLLGVYGLAIDEDRGTLWAAMAAGPAMRGYSSDQEGNAGLGAIDLATGAVRDVFLAPRGADGRPHALADLVLAGDGSLFATDSTAGMIWRLAPGARALATAVESPEFLALQGIALLRGGALLVADRINGILRVDPASGAVVRLEPPAGATLVGIDGVTPTRDDGALALQSGVRPVRVLQLHLDAAAESVTAVKVLDAGHLTLSAPSRGCLGPDGDYYFIANPGWNRFDDGEGRPTAPRPVAIFRTKLPKPKAAAR